MGLLASTGLLKTAVVLTDAVYGALTLSLALSRRQQKNRRSGFLLNQPDILSGGRPSLVIVLDPQRSVLKGMDDG